MRIRLLGESVHARREKCVREFAFLVYFCVETKTKVMEYNARHRDIVGTVGFFLLGVVLGGFSPAIATLREYAQYRRNGKLEHGDLLRYVLVGSAGAVVQMVVLIVLLIIKM